MGKVIRVVRVPEWDEKSTFELSLPRGAEIFKLDFVFTGAVDTEGKPIQWPGLYMLVTEGEQDLEARQFQVAYLSSGVDDLISESEVLPGSAYRYISNIQRDLMLFENLDAQSNDTAPGDAVID